MARSAAARFAAAALNEPFVLDPLPAIRRLGDASNSGGSSHVEPLHEENARAVCGMRVRRSDPDSEHRPRTLMFIVQCNTNFKTELISTYW